MRRNTRPPRISSGLPMLSIFSGNVPGATSNFTSLLTSYVPLPVIAPVESNVVQFPPPVTSSVSSGLKVPEPVRVIFEPSFARADALPPAKRVPVVKSMLTRSQRILVSSAPVLALTASHREVSTTAIARNHFLSILMFVLLFCDSLELLSNPGTVPRGALLYPQQRLLCK